MPNRSNSNNGVEDAAQTWFDLMASSTQRNLERWNAFMEAGRAMQRRSTMVAFGSTAAAGEMWRDAIVAGQRFAELNTEAFWDWTDCSQRMLGAVAVAGLPAYDWPRIWGEAWSRTQREEAPPAQSAQKPEWVGYAVRLGADQKEAEEMTKAELIERYT